MIIMLTNATLIMKIIKGINKKGFKMDKIEELKLEIKVLRDKVKVFKSHFRPPRKIKIINRMIIYIKYYIIFFINILFIMSFFDKKIFLLFLINTLDIIFYQYKKNKSTLMLTYKMLELEY